MGFPVIVLVSGSRHATAYEYIRDKLVFVAGCYGSVASVRLWHGKARGADLLADAVGIERGWDRRGFAADWTRYGKAAGPIRNQEMIDALLAEDDPVKVVVAFPDPTSRGTADCIERAWRAGIPVFVFPLMP